MSTKKVSIGAKPTSKPAPAAADAWVESRTPAEGPEPMKRLTIDIPAGLHKRVKSQCANQGTTIADVVRAYLERKFPDSKP